MASFVACGEEGRATLVRAEHAPYMLLFDAAGKPIWSAP
jgi:hypothetical protein